MSTVARRISSPSGLRLLVSSWLLVLLPACGGGGGGAAITPGPGPLPGPTRSPQTAVFVTEDGQRLYGVADDGTAAPVALATPAMTVVRQLAVSPDGGAVAFVADCDILDRFELYVREIGGTAPVKVSSLTSPVCDVLDFQWSPDSQRLAYRADGLVDDRAELFVARRTGAGHYRAYESGVVSVFVAGYGWSPDSRYLYCTLQQTATQSELRLHDASTGAEGAAAVIAMPPGRQLLDVTFSPDSQWLALRADHLGALGQFQVFRRRVDQPGALTLSNGAAGTVAKIGGYAWSPDSRWLAQTVFATGSNAKVGINVFELATPLSRRVFTGSFDGIAWAPDRNDLAIAGDFDPVTNAPAGELRMLVHDADANTSRTVSAAFTAGEQLRGDLFAWSPTGQRLAYVTRRAGNADSVFLVVPTGLAAAVRASETSSLEVAKLVWDHGGTHLALLERDQGSAFHPGEWHVVGSDGRSKVRSGSFHTYATSLTVRWSGDDARVMFAVDVAAGGPDRLRSALRDGGGDVQLTSEGASAMRRFEHASATLPKP